MLLFIKIGFLELNFLDLLDIFLVGLLIYQVYRLLKGSIAFNIFLGLLLVYFVWFIVRILEMELLEGILSQFVGVGVIALLIVFQPEVRKFLLFLGRSGRVRRHNLQKSFGWKKNKGNTDHELVIKEIALAIENMSKARTGGIIVLSETSKLQFYANTGVIIEGAISSKLLESIFEKNSPLHDGAVIIADLRIVAAGCVLPVSDNPDLPSRLGMRHKATVGITEISDAIAFVISEERGNISYARNGSITQEIKIEEVSMLLTEYFESFD